MALPPKCQVTLERHLNRSTSKNAGMGLTSSCAIYRTTLLLWCFTEHHLFTSFFGAYNHREVIIRF